MSCYFKICFNLIQIYKYDHIRSFIYSCHSLLDLSANKLNKIQMENFLFAVKFMDQHDIPVFLAIKNITQLSTKM
jgi:hypothetical protein